MHEIHSQKPAPADFDKIRRIEGFERIRSEYPAYLTDESKLSPEPFDHLFFPLNESELAAVLEWAAERGVGVTVAGARTGLVGGCVPCQGALVSLENFDRVQAVYYDQAAAEWRVRSQCAVSLRSLGSQIAAKRFPDIERCGDPSALAALDSFRQTGADFFYPPDPTEMSASLGGTVATNASGARTYRYGPTRGWIRAIRVMLPQGDILSLPRGKYFASPGGTFTIYDPTGRGLNIRLPSYPMPRTKNTCGFFTAPQMDLIDLFIGSEGCFGVITEVTVALLERRQKISMVQFLQSDQQALDLVAVLRRDSRIQLDFLEFYSGNALALLRRRQRQDPKSVDMPDIPDRAGAALFLEFDFDPLSERPDAGAFERTLRQGGADPGDSWAAHENREMQRLKNFRHILPETINAIIAERKKQYPELHKLGTDLAVPDECLEDMWQIYRDGLEQADLQWVAFGHIGNNHIHINILPRDGDELQRGLELYSRFATRAVGFGGTVSAEHGIGKMKIKFLKLMYSPGQIAEMQAVKQAFDPEGRLNPGNLFG